jgi:hypothetical protein
MLLMLVDACHLVLQAKMLKKTQVFCQLTDVAAPFPASSRDAT